MFGRRSRPSGTGSYFASAPAAVPEGRSLDPVRLADRAKNWARLALTGALGILAAIVMDLKHRGDDSALFVVTRGLVGAAAMVGVTSLPLYVTIGVLMAVGAGVVLYFRPRGLRPAFMTGFGSLAALTTAVPGYSGEYADVPIQGEPGTPAPVIERRDLVEAPRDTAPPMRLASFVTTEAAPPSASTEARYDLTVRLSFPRGVPEPVAAHLREGTLKTRLYDPATGRAYDLFARPVGPVLRDGDTLQVTASIPASAPSGPLWLRVEAAGYEIGVFEHEANVEAGERWDVALTPTTEPLLIQRLKHTYAF